MLAVRDIDHHLAREARQLAGAGVWRHGDRQARRAARHDAGVVKDEGAGAAVQGAADALDRHVDARALNARHAVQHLALAGAFELAIELLVDGHPAKAFVPGICLLRAKLDFERAFCMSRHDRPFLDCTWIRRLGLRKRRCANAEDQAEAHDGYGRGAISVFHTARTSETVMKEPSY